MENKKYFIDEEKIGLATDVAVGIIGRTKKDGEYLDQEKASFIKKLSEAFEIKNGKASFSDQEIRQIVRDSLGIYKSEILFAVQQVLSGYPEYYNLEENNPLVGTLGYIRAKLKDGSTVEGGFTAMAPFNFIDETQTPPKKTTPSITIQTKTEVRELPLLDIAEISAFKDSQLTEPNPEVENMFFNQERVV